MAAGEDSDSCGQDCTCGNGVCDAAESADHASDPWKCDQDCGTCGDGACALAGPNGEKETPATCEANCGACGNGQCEPDRDEFKVEEVYGLACPDDCCTTEGAILCPDKSAGLCAEWLSWQ